MNPMEDNKVKEAILKGTEEAAELKDMIWDNIKNELNIIERDVINMKSRKGKIAPFFKYGSIAAAVALIIAANTQYGRAAVGKVKEIFAPSKTVKQNIEGMPTEDKVALKEGSSEYVIYLDEKIYAMESINGKERIEPNIKAGNGLEVFMEIEYSKDKTPQSAAEELMNGLKKEFSKVEDRGMVKSPLDAHLLYARSGLKSKDHTLKYYIVANPKGGCFIIKQKYFNEAEEGHGARMDNMLKEFKIVNK